MELTKIDKSAVEIDVDHIVAMVQLPDCTEVISVGAPMAHSKTIYVIETKAEIERRIDTDVASQFPTPWNLARGGNTLSIVSRKQTVCSGPNTKRCNALFTHIIEVMDVH